VLLVDAPLGHAAVRYVKPFLALAMISPIPGANTSIAVTSGCRSVAYILAHVGEDVFVVG
jgi:hypothetical protein